ncbi:hypothetical protein [Actinomycetospora aeridis]|uniref:Uncharacterized protein n=1 Tax=Actinomycetospora aeridis TaxID=3129231 RepID=A0ABU8NAK4_9PSEU
MADDERTVDGASTLVPTPGTGRQHRAGRAGTPPGTRAQWVTAVGQVSGLLLALRQVETEGAVLPPPLARGTALRAWSAVTRPVLRDPERLTGTDARVMDLAMVERAARVLGRSLCRAWVIGGGDVVVSVLRREATVHACGPERLVAQVARVHGALTSDDGRGARMVWDALDG